MLFYQEMSDKNEEVDWMITVMKIIHMRKTESSSWLNFSTFLKHYETDAKQVLSDLPKQHIF